MTIIFYNSSMVESQNLAGEQVVPEIETVTPDEIITKSRFARAREIAKRVKDVANAGQTREIVYRGALIVKEVMHEVARRRKEQPPNIPVVDLDEEPEIPESVNLARDLAKAFGKDLPLTDDQVKAGLRTKRNVERIIKSARELIIQISDTTVTIPENSENFKKWERMQDPKYANGDEGFFGGKNIKLFSHRTEAAKVFDVDIPSSPMPKGRETA